MLIFLSLYVAVVNFCYFYLIVKYRQVIKSLSPGYIVDIAMEYTKNGGT